jgi:hypothetical protein
MNDKRPQPHYVVPSSLNEVERKKEVDRVNFENKLMMDRLNKMSPTLSNDKLESDFKRHLHAESNLRRKQMKPLSLPKDMYRAQENSSLFDSATYASQHDLSSHGASKGDSISVLDDFDSVSSPIKSMKEFRQHVISAKKISGRRQYRPKVAGIQEPQPRSQLEYSKSEALFEIVHEPKEYRDEVHMVR